MKSRTLQKGQTTMEPWEGRLKAMDAVQTALGAAIEKLKIGVECGFRRETLELIESRAYKEAGGTTGEYVGRLASLSAYFFIIGYCQKLLGTGAQEQLEKEILAGLVKAGVKLPCVK